MKPKAYNSYSQEEWAAFKAARDAGVPFPDDETLYPLPYTIYTRSTLFIKNNFIKLENGSAIYEGEYPKFIFRVEFQESPFSNWFTEKREARKNAEKLNVRHFRVAGNSTNPAMPVLL